jgi:RND family efflux transporter MFP subunit
MSSRDVLGSVAAVLMAFVGSVAICTNAAGDDEIAFQTVGYIVPKSQVAVSSRVAGQVFEMNIDEGKVVKKGDVLARLESSEYKADLEAAKARVQIANAKLEKSKSATTTLHDTAIAKAELTLATAELDKAQVRLDATEIRAPIDGTILTKKAEVGTYLHPLGFNVTPSICEMANLRELEVDVCIAERDIKNIATGQTCHVQLDAFPEAVYKGRVSRILPIADRSKGSINVRVKVEVPEKDQQLRPEMRAVVSFLDKK